MKNKIKIIIASIAAGLLAIAGIVVSILFGRDKKLAQKIKRRKDEIKKVTDSNDEYLDNNKPYKL